MRYAIGAVVALSVALYWLFDHILWFVTLYCYRVEETRDDDNDSTFTSTFTLTTTTKKTQLTKLSFFLAIGTEICTDRVWLTLQLVFG